MKVSLADLPAQYQSIQSEINSAIHDVMMSAQFILGPTLEKLENSIADFCGAKYAIGVNSGTDALLLSLVANEFEPGSEIITSPFTFVATAEAIALAGLKPVFADICPNTFNLDPESVGKVITARTKAIMPVDLFGQMCDRSAYVELAAKYHLELIWDSAQALGSKFEDKRLGEWPGHSTLSFFPTKNLGACGDAGMIVTNSTEFRDKLKNYRFHGSGGNYIYSRIGYCSRLDALQAAILSVKLPHLEDWNSKRRNNAEKFLEQVSNPAITLPTVDTRAHHIFHQFTLRCDSRDHLRTYLNEHSIDTGVYYPKALHLQEAYAYLGYKQGDCPNSEVAANTVLSIPVHPNLTESQTDYVVETLNKYVP